MRLDLVVENARIATMNPDRPFIESFGVLNGRIVASDEAESFTANRRLDARGRLIVPGFADAHNHMTWYGVTLFEADLSGCTSLNELYERLAQHADSHPGSPVLIGNGYLHTEMGGAHPDKNTLDNIAKGKPLWLRHGSGHISMVNSVVLEAVGLDRSIPEQLKPYVKLDSRGMPNGVLEETAQTLVVREYTPYRLGHIARGIQLASKKYVAQGLTSVTEAGVGSGWISKSPIELQAFQRLHERGDLPVRVELMPTSAALHSLEGHPEDDLVLGLDLGMTSGFGSERLRIGPMKMWFDGGLTSRTAKLREPFCDCHGSGHFQEDPELMASKMSLAVRSGWQLAIHVIGDEGIGRVLDIFEALAKEHPVSSMRHRFEHAGMTTSDDIKRMKRLGITAVIQPRFLHTLGDSMYAAVGAQRSNMLYRAKSFLDEGMRFVSSSDRPVTDGDPLRGIASLLQRKSRSGKVIGPDEAVDVMSALRSYTADSAWISKAERSRGMIADGMCADFTVLSSDIIKNPRTAENTTVLSTYLDGDCVYEQ